MRIRSERRGLFVVQLTHAAVCEAVGECSCLNVGGRLIPGSITLKKGETVEVHPSVIELREVDRALRNGALTLVPEPKTVAREREEMSE